MTSRFKHGSAVALLLLVALTSIASAVGPRVTETTFKCRRSLAAVAGGYVDSTTQTIGGDAVTLDTSTVVTTIDWDWTKTIAGAANTTAQVAAELFVWTAGAPASFDTLWVAIDRRITGGAWASGSFVGYLPGAANDPLIVVPLTPDYDDKSSIALVPELRFRFRSDGNSAAVFPGAKFTIRHFKYNQ